MSARLDLGGVTKAFPGAPDVLRGVDLAIEPGEFVCLVGPSGSGKTTLLRTIAGLLDPDAGDIRLNGRSLLGVPAARRGIAVVFQADTLFADLTVAENVAFGLAGRRGRRPGDAESVQVALLRLGLTGLEERYPDELSGGQQRRVALARALVLAPAVMLLDEPVAGLDEELRAQIVRQIRANHRRLGLTTVMVTHDQSEALALADRLVLMERGAIAQAGRPREVYERPDSTSVARFLGRSNFADAEVLRLASGPDHAVVVSLFGGLVRVPAHAGVTRVGQAVSVMVRPHALALEPAPAQPGWTEVAGELGMVAEVSYLGDRTEYVVESEHGSLVAVGDPGAGPAEGDAVRLRVEASRLWALPAGR